MAVKKIIQSVFLKLLLLVYIVFILEVNLHVTGVKCNKARVLTASYCLIGTLKRKTFSLS